MVTGVFLFIEISYMLLLSYPIKYFFKLVIRNTQNFFYHLLFPIGKIHRFSFLKRVKLKIFCSQITAISIFPKMAANFNITI